MLITSNVFSASANVIARSEWKRSPHRNWLENSGEFPIPHTIESLFLFLRWVVW